MLGLVPCPFWYLTSRFLEGWPDLETIELIQPRASLPPRPPRADAAPLGGAYWRGGGRGGGNRQGKGWAALQRPTAAAAGSGLVGPAALEP